MAASSLAAPWSWPISTTVGLTLRLWSHSTGPASIRLKSLVTSVSFERPAKNAFHFTKAIRRRPVSAAVVTIAALLPLKRGKIAGARIAYGAMAETAIRVPAVEAALEGKALDEAAIAAAAEVANKGTRPRDDAYASAWYRREVLPVHLRRLLEARGSA